jgi:hypothetical protein
MKGKTRGKCEHCQIVWRWLRSFGRITEMCCPTCKGSLEAAPWGLLKIIQEGCQFVDRRPEKRKDGEEESKLEVRNVRQF